MPTDTSLELFHLFKSLIKKANEIWNQSSGDTFTISQYRMLHILGKRGKHKVVDLADVLQVTPGAITGMSDRMIRFGLISRIRDDVDRRVVYLEITDEGRAKQAELSAKYHALFADVLNQIPDEDKAHLQRIFTHMHELLESSSKE